MAKKDTKTPEPEPMKRPFPKNSIPKFVMPVAAKEPVITDPPIHDLMDVLHQQRALQVAQHSMDEFKKNPKHKKDTAVLLLPPHPNEMGYIAAYGLEVARRERISMLSLVKERIERLHVIEEMLAGLQNLCQKAGLMDEVHEIDDALSDFATLVEDIISDTIAERGPIDPKKTQASWRQTSGNPGGEGVYEFALAVPQD